MHVLLLMLIAKSNTLVFAGELLELQANSTQKLQVCAPMRATLAAPPYESAPADCTSVCELDLQLTQGVSSM
jgi:hypothetical protein